MSLYIQGRGGPTNEESQGSASVSIVLYNSCRFSGSGPAPRPRMSRYSCSYGVTVMVPYRYLFAKLHSYLFAELPIFVKLIT